MSAQNSPAATEWKPLLSINDITAAATALRDYQPLELPLPSGEFTINKLSAEDYDAVLADLEADDGLFALLGLGEEEGFSPANLIPLLRRVPRTVKVLVANGVGGYHGDKKVGMDELILLAAAVITVTFIDNAAVRCFFTAAKGAGLSVTAERSSEPMPAHGGTTEG